jgi:HAD domain in Swiss Army Knife RNA repair proteins
MYPPRPLILVDVDGVLNPARPDAGGYRRHWVFPNGVAHRLLLNPSHGQMLTDLAEAAGAELVWASYWQDKANTWIAPRIGLPSLRFVPITRLWIPRARSWLGEWKARHVVPWIGQTPFVWLEDNLGVPRHLAQQQGLGRHLVVPVDPAIGLTHHHITRARTWLDDLRTHPDHIP